MKTRHRKIPSIRKGTSSAVLLSVLIHAGLFLLAGVLIVFKVVHKEEAEFIPPRAIERPKMKLKKPRMKIKKSSRPKAPARIVSRRTDVLPVIQLPDIADVGDGLGDDFGTDFGPLPELDDVSIFGSGQSIGNDLVGTFYDFKRDRNNRKIVYSQDEYRAIIRSFMKNGWKVSELARYYKSPRKLYATCFIVPPCLSEIAPEAFGEFDTEGKYWMAHYKGELVHKDGITFRFIGAGDEVIVVRLDGRIVFGSAWWNDESTVLGGIWLPPGSESKRYWMGNQRANVGEWITLEPGVALPLEILMADNGGQASLMLAVEEKGVEYERTGVGGPIFPAFKTAELSHDMLDAIYKNLVSGEVSLTNGPVFSDYHVPSEPSSETQPEEPVEEEPDALRPTIADKQVWQLRNGQQIEATYQTMVGQMVVLKDGRGRQIKRMLSDFSDESRALIELANPPDLGIDFSVFLEDIFSIIDGNPSGERVGFHYSAKAKVRQTSIETYNHRLKVEFFAVGKEIHGDRFRLFDRQESSFIPTEENDRSHSFSGRKIRIPDFVLSDVRLGEAPEGFLVTVTDERGVIIQHRATRSWLFENLDQLKRLPVGAYMDESCRRVYPTGPPRTRY